MRLNAFSGAMLALIAAGAACGSSGATATTTAPTTTTTPSTGTSGGTSTTNTTGMYSQFGGTVTVSIEGSTAVLRTTDVPDHKSPYFGAGHPMYEAPHPGMTVNPHSIASQNIVMRVPLVPQVASPSDTPLGPIGVAVNGVVFFNQYAAGRQPLTSEIFSFDRYNGHPAPSNQYHYHFEPVWITAASKSRLIGVLLDGFPLYGPNDAGGTPADLDACNGHVAPTPEFPEGLYHYHTTTAVPYISGCFRGAQGTIG
jgi:YHYH protein